MIILPSDIPIDKQPKWKSLRYSKETTIVLKFNTDEERSNWFSFHMLQANLELCKREKEQEFLNGLIQ